MSHGFSCRIRSWLPTWSPSPNHGERAGHRAPDMILLHYTGMKDAVPRCGVSARTTARSRRTISSSKTAASFNACPETRRAWHAGESSGPAKTTSIRARSVSRSPIRAMISAIRIFPAADRGNHRACVARSSAGADPRRAHARPFRCRAGAQAGPGREIPLAFAAANPASAIGSAGPDHFPDPDSSSATSVDADYRQCRLRSRNMATGFRRRLFRRRQPRRRHRFPAAFPSRPVDGLIDSTLITLRALLDRHRRR